MVVNVCVRVWFGVGWMKALVDQWRGGGLNDGVPMYEGATYLFVLLCASGLCYVLLPRDWAVVCGAGESLGGSEKAPVHEAVGGSSVSGIFLVYESTCWATAT